MYKQITISRRRDYDLWKFYISLKGGYGATELYRRLRLGLGLDPLISTGDDIFLTEDEIDYNKSNKPKLYFNEEVDKELIDWIEELQFNNKIVSREIKYYICKSLKEDGFINQKSTNIIDKNTNNIDKNILQDKNKDYKNAYTEDDDEEDDDDDFDLESQLKAKFKPV